MAIVNDEEQQVDPNKPNAPTTGGTTASPTGSGQGVAGQNQMSPGMSNVQQNVAPQNSQGYTDVGAYLNANQAGSQDLGNKVAANLTSGYNQTKGAIDTSAQKFQGAVNQGYTPENTELIKQVAANPTVAASDQNQLTAFQGQLNDTYAGPTDWADYGSLQGQVNEANQQAGLVDTAGGRNVLAQQVEGANTSQGINQLDALLLGAPDAYNTTKAAANPYSTLNDYLNAQNTAGLGAVSNAQTQAQNASQRALNAFTGANGTLTNLNTGINTATQQALAKAQAQNEAVKAGIGGIYGGQAIQNDPTSLTTYGGGATPWYNTTNYTAGALSPEVLASLGLTADQGLTLQDAMQQAGTTSRFVGHNFGANSPTSQIDLSQYLNQQDPTQAINAGTVATPEQYAQMAAIQQLLGSKNPAGNAINPALASLAGTAPTKYNNFDYEGALGNATQTAAQQRQAAQDMANQLTNSADAAHAASKQHGFKGALNKILPTAAKYAANPLLVVPQTISETKKLGSKI